MSFEEQLRKVDKRVVKGSKILILDIERLPGLVPIWDQRTPSFTPVYKWTRLPSLLCVAAQWYDRPAIEFHAAWDDHAAMVKRSWEMYDAAEIVVGYNHVRFDNAHLRSEWLLAGLPPPKPWRNVDLFKVNKAHFGFESKSLAHLCQRLGLPGKSGHYDADLAEAAMAGDVKAQRKMRVYNAGDVKITRMCYDALRPWVNNHPHIGDMPSDPVPTCNACGSINLVRNGLTRAVVIDYVLYRCSDCGANVRSGEHSRAALTRGVS